MTEPADGPVADPVFTLVVDVGRSPEDGLPQGATGARLLCYAAAADEADAVRVVVAELKAAGLAPLDVEGYGTAEDREIEPEEAALMAQAADEGAVIVAELTPLWPDSERPHPVVPDS